MTALKKEKDELSQKRLQEIQKEIANLQNKFKDKFLFNEKNCQKSFLLICIYSFGSLAA